MLKLQGKAKLIFPIIKALSERHPDMTIKEYYWLAFANGR